MVSLGVRFLRFVCGTGRCLSRLPFVSAFVGRDGCVRDGCEVRLRDLCVRVSRVSLVCPGSPRYLFTGTVPVRAVVRVRVCWWVWMVVRFFCVIRVLVRARLSRVCGPGFPGVFLPVPVVRYSTGVCPGSPVSSQQCSQDSFRATWCFAATSTYGIILY